MLPNIQQQCYRGIEQGENLSDTGFDWIGDIYRLSGSDWTVTGQINNPYLNAIRSSELIADWKAQGMNDDKIQEKILKDGTLSAVIAPIDVNNILKLVDIVTTHLKPQLIQPITANGQLRAGVGFTVVR
ncbi:TPA: hypothetical protein ACSEXO_003642 [Proteus mirabilis]|uniref:hypothetical protein n=1 Tax=Proteus mirabilis TaxID=584 RepID=UPI0018C694DC|nr:hypothetical protein [Proteus mirabilis]MBG2744325.1 hypothetical protein [Proteus mirabilis]MDM3843335.1 hypothetical protein [Proteus mirabilis]